MQGSGFGAVWGWGTVGHNLLDLERGSADDAKGGEVLKGAAMGTFARAVVGIAGREVGVRWSCQG